MHKPNRDKLPRAIPFFLLTLAAFAILGLSQIRETLGFESSKTATKANPAASLGQAIESLEKHIRQLPGYSAKEPGWQPAPAEALDADRIRRLIEIYETGGADRRHGVMDTLSYEFPVYAGEAREKAETFLPFFRRVLRSKVYVERQLAAIALHGPSTDGVVDLLAEALASEYPKVRFYSAEGLAWCVRAGNHRAEAPLLAALSHPDPRVRAMAAISIAVISPSLRGADTALLASLAREEDRRAIEGMASAVTKLDPKNGPGRLREVMAQRNPSLRQLVEKAIDNILT